MKKKRESKNQVLEYFKTYKTSYLMMLPYLLFFAAFTILPVIVSAVS